MSENKKIIVIHHSADFDGLFCREIARKHLGDTAEYIGWDFGDKPLELRPDVETVYVLDLPIDRVFGFDYAKPETIPLAFMAHGDCKAEKIIWIDHHKSSIQSHPGHIDGYRIDGVAACRLAWQWFALHEKLFHPSAGSFAVPLPTKEQFINREVSEPYAVQLAGEYDIWDKRNPAAEVFQLGLRSRKLTDADWADLLLPTLDTFPAPTIPALITDLLKDGRLLQSYVNERDAGTVNALGFIVEFEGLKFLALNSAGKGSLQFAAKDVPETGHDALLKFNWTGTTWDVSLYHARHRTELDLSAIAVKHGGGGHRGACGFRAASLPFLKGQI